jgi:hypothetical protein
MILIENIDSSITWNLLKTTKTNKFHKNHISARNIGFNEDILINYTEAIE